MPSPPAALDALIQSVHSAIEFRHGIPLPGHRRTKEEAASYSWGSVLDLREGMDATRFLGAGWCEPEVRLCWTGAHSVEVNLPVKPLGGGHLLLTARVTPHLSATTTAQVTRISVNGGPVGLWTVREAGLRHVIIFERHFAGRSRLKLVFDLPNAFSPHSQGPSADIRLLALAFQSLSLTPINGL